MTQAARRKLRIVWEPETTKPWIVQYDTRDTPDHTWTDVHRFDTCVRATSYATEVQLRDKLLLEAER